jgi:hypothetical protein
LDIVVAALNAEGGFAWPAGEVAFESVARVDAENIALVGLAELIAVDRIIKKESK